MMTAIWATMKTVSNASLFGVMYDVAFDANAHHPSCWYGK
jgi:hypothetical protein